jgi:myo-inositol-1(or 4)-monophosphatase
MAEDFARDLERITQALRRSGALLLDHLHRGVVVDYKSGDDPVTEADRAADALLHELLPSEGDGWLSEETRDDPAQRRRCRRVWIVDPIDGTREFVTGIPEWCVSVALAVDGEPVAGGIFNPVAGLLIAGARGLGVQVDGARVELPPRASLQGATVLASNSEFARGEWQDLAEAPFTVVPCGSIAYKLGLVGAGRADATWTFTPKNEWDLAGGAAVVLEAGGAVLGVDGAPLTFNRPNPRLPGVVAFSAGSRALFEPWFASRWRTAR